MLLKELINTLAPDTKLMIRQLGDPEMIEITSGEILTECPKLAECIVDKIWISYNLYRALMVELIKPHR